MAKQLRCPNPTCTHVFSAKEVQTAELLKCPRCGRAFRIRPPGSAPPAAPAPAKPATRKPAAPIAKAAPTVPVAAPVVMPKPAVPVAAPVTPLAKPITMPASESIDVEPVDVEPVELPASSSESEPDAFADAAGFAAPEEDHGPLVRSRGVIKNPWTAKHYIVLSLGLMTLAGLVTGIIVFRGNIHDLFTQNGDDASSHARLFTVRNLSNKDEKAFKLAAPERWSADAELKKRLGALTAWKHDDGDGWLAVAVQDFGQQRPRDGEMMKAAIERLEGHFGDALELANKAFKSELAGMECQCLRFKGTYNTVTWFGECYLLPHHGFGYWFFVATSTPWERDDDAADVKKSLESNNGFALVTDRKGWTEQPPKMDTFHAQTAPLSISVPSGAWEKSPAKDVEETGELFLFGRFLREKDNRKNASILVFTSDKKSDLKESLRAARSYLEKRKQEENDKYKFLSAQEGASESGAQEAVGDHAGWLTELKLMFNDEPKRYSLLAVVHHDARAYVVHCDCAWEHRQIWQQDFRNALGTLKFEKRD